MIIFGTSHISEQSLFTLRNDHETIKLIESNGSSRSVKMNLINNLNGNSVNYKDIVKLSNEIRYIMIGSSGIKNHNLTNNVKFYLDAGNFYISGILSIYVTCYKISHVRLTSFRIKHKNLEVYNNSNNSMKISIITNSSNDKLTTIHDFGETSNNLEEILSPNGYDTSSYFNINNLNNDLKFKIQVQIGRLYNSKDDTIYETEVSVDNEILNALKNQHYFCNSLVELDVYDENGTNVSFGKPITSNQKNNVISINGGNVTDNNHIDQSKYVRTSGADTFILDLGQEYKISKLNVWRKWNDIDTKTDIYENEIINTLFQEDFIYQDNFIYGLNKDKEICYKFYDYRSNNYFGYTEKSETENGREFLIDNISNLENMPHP